MRSPIVRRRAAYADLENGHDDQLLPVDIGDITFISNESSFLTNYAGEEAEQCGRNLKEEGRPEEARGPMEDDTTFPLHILLSLFSL